jgi:hypothetical protein
MMNVNSKWISQPIVENVGQRPKTRRGSLRRKICIKSDILPRDARRRISIKHIAAPAAAAGALSFEVPPELQAR